LTNRTILVIGLILVIAIATNWFIEITEQQPPPATMARNDPDLYMVNAEMTQFNEKGEMEQQISAQRMTHFPLTDVTTLKEPNLKLYSASEEAPWDIVALNGRMLPKALLRDEIVELWDEYEAATTPEARLAKALDKLETILQHTQGDNPPGFDYRFNLGYGREYTAGDPLIEAMRRILDEETERRAEEEEG